MIICHYRFFGDKIALSSYNYFLKGVEEKAFHLKSHKLDSLIQNFRTEKSWIKSIDIKKDILDLIVSLENKEVEKGVLWI